MTYCTNKDWLHAEAEKAGIPLRTLDEVQSTMREAHKQGAWTWTAQLMLKHGRMTNEAREWLQGQIPQ